MDILRYFLLLVEVVTCILLVGVILLQKSKGQGIGLAFGAGVGETLFGAQAGNVLTKTTVVLAFIFLLNTTILSLIGAGRRTTGRSIADKIPATQPVMPQTAPSAGPAAGTPAGGMPAGQLPAPGAQSAVDQPSAPLPPVSAQPVKTETAPVPAPVSTGAGQTPVK